MRRSGRGAERSGRRALAEFALLTVLVMLLTLPVGLLIRGMGAPAESVPLMKLGQIHADQVHADQVHAEKTPAAPAVVPPVMPPVIPPLVPATDDVLAMPAPLEAEQPAATAAPDDVVMFNGRPLRKAKTLNMLVTAYSPDEQSCGIWADGITASGYSVWTNGMKLVAADTRLLPFGSVITVPGYNGGNPVPVLDRGGVIKGHRLDVLYPTHEIALKWGAQRLPVTVWEYADEQ